MGLGRGDCENNWWWDGVNLAGSEKDGDPCGSLSVIIKKKSKDAATKSV